MATSKPKFTAADRKALALAAFLFFLDREYHVELNHYTPCSYIRLTVYFSKTQELEQCPLLDWPFVSCEEHDLGAFDRVCEWEIPL